MEKDKYFNDLNSILEWIDNEPEENFYKDEELLIWLPNDLNAVPEGVKQFYLNEIEKAKESKVKRDILIKMGVL